MTTTKNAKQVEHTYEFYWSPEGRKLCTITATCKTNARAEFKRLFPAHARYMGEVYVIIDGER